MSVTTTPAVATLPVAVVAPRMGEPTPKQKAALSAIAGRQVAEAADKKASPEEEAAGLLEALGFKGGAAALRGNIPEPAKAARVLLQVLRADNVPSFLKGTKASPGLIRRAIEAAWAAHNAAQAADAEPGQKPVLRLASLEGKKTLVAEAEAAIEAGTASEELLEAASAAYDDLEAQETAEAEAAMKAALAEAEEAANAASVKAAVARAKATKFLRILAAELSERDRRSREDAAATLMVAGSGRLASAVRGDKNIPADERIRLLEEAESRARPVTSPLGSLWCGLKSALDEAHEARRQEAAYRARNFRAKNGGAFKPRREE